MAERPTLRQLEYFLAAVEHGSFASAAIRTHIAQPSLSDQIRRLERAVGSPLFIRTNRRLQLTDVGRQLIPLAEATLRSADRLNEALRQVRTLEGGVVSFGTFSSAHLYLLVPLTQDFHARHPKVRIRVVGLNSAEVADKVRDGELEAGLVQLPIDEQGLEVSGPVLTDSVVYASSDPRRARAPVTIETLAEADLILSEARFDDDPLRRTIADRARAAGLTIEPFVEVEFQTAALELASQGVGDTLVSYLVAQLRRYAGRISFVPLDPPLEERFVFITRVNSPLSPATREFMALARRHMSNLQSQSGSWVHEFSAGRALPD